MSQFWLGFMTATALYAVGIIALSTWMYVRGERKRKAETDAMMAKIGLMRGDVVIPHYAPKESPSPQGKKGVH